MAKIINVAVGILQQDNHVLLTSRPPDKSNAGSWEFPGGKIEQNEDSIMAVIRELNEELGIKVVAEDCVLIGNMEQNYEHSIVRLSLVLINLYTGIPQGLEKQNLYWQDRNSPCKLYPLLPTTIKILEVFQGYVR